MPGASLSYFSYNPVFPTYRQAPVFTRAQFTKWRPLAMPSPFSIPSHRLPAGLRADDDEEQPLTSTDLLPKEDIKMADEMDNIMDDLAIVMSGMQVSPWKALDLPTEFRGWRAGSSPTEDDDSDDDEDDHHDDDEDGGTRRELPDEDIQMDDCEVEDVVRLLERW
ncbi:hypothetical protein BGX23_004085 [Mortierella sp. AD031]|nr:hypothetical protein BGX23_004085 [Mortierella sp. AD031]